VNAPSDSGLRIRPYRDPDQAAVVALWRACGLTRPWNDPASDIAHCLKSREAALLVGEDAGGRVVASVMVGQDGHRGWMYYVAVDPDRQKSGYGRALVAAAEAWHNARGVPKSMLLVRAENARVIAFYRALGYEVEERVLMTRWLKTPPAPPGP